MKKQLYKIACEYFGEPCVSCWGDKEWVAFYNLIKGLL